MRCDDFVPGLEDAAVDLCEARGQNPYAITHQWGHFTVSHGITLKDIAMKELGEARLLAFILKKHGLSPQD